MKNSRGKEIKVENDLPPPASMLPMMAKSNKPEPESRSSGMKRQMDMPPPPALPAATRHPVQRPAAPRHPVQRCPWMAMTVPPPPPPIPKPKSEGVGACSSGMKRQIDMPPPPALPAPRRSVQRRLWMAMAVPPLPTLMPVTVFYRAELLMMFCKTADCKVPEPVLEPSDFIQPPNENPIGLNGLNRAVKRNSIIRFIEQRNARRCKDGKKVAEQKNDEDGTSQVKKPKTESLEA